LYNTALHQWKARKGGGFGSEQGGVEASIFAFQPKLWIFGNGTVLCIEDHDGGMKVPSLLVSTAFGLQI
jgi:hypothetical protein